MLNKIFHGPVIYLGQENVSEERIDPLIEGVATIRNRRCFEWTALAAGERLEPNLPLSLEGDIGGCFDEGLRGVDTKRFELLGRLAFCDCALLSALLARYSRCRSTTAVFDLLDTPATILIVGCLDVRSSESLRRSHCTSLL